MPKFSRLEKIIGKDKLKDYCGGQTYVATCGVFLVFCSDFYRVSLAFEKTGKSKELVSNGSFMNFSKALD